MPRGRGEGDADDVWRGSRAVLVLVVIAGAIVFAIVLAADRSRPGASDGGGGLNVLVASYDLAAERPQRVVIGLVTDDERVVSFGHADLSFSFVGDQGGVPVAGPDATATWQPVPGSRASDRDDAAVTDVTGVYVARNVEFDRPGYWQVDVVVEVNGARLESDAAFEVFAEPQFPSPGAAAPRTQNPVASDQDVDARALDSRSDPGGTVPDPDLHAISVADAIAMGRPTMVIVSTPVYCISRFCGPLTDAVQALARTYGDRMSFVHLEVWRDYDGRILNPAAAEWIEPPGAEESKEPWVWVIDASGTIVARFDNIASDAELEDAVRAVLR